MATTYVFLYKDIEESPAFKITCNVPEDILRKLSRKIELLSLKKDADEMYELDEDIQVWFYGDLYRKIPPAMDAMKELPFGECVPGPIIMYNLTLMA